MILILTKLFFDIINEWSEWLKILFGFSVLLSFHPLPLVVSALITNGSPSKNHAIKTPLVELLFIFRH